MSIVPQTMRRPSDCMATAVGVLIGVDALELPATGGADWDAAWNDLRRAVARYGWRLSYTPWDGTDHTLADLLALPDEGDWDEIERALYWLVAVDHPSWNGEGHVLILQGDRIAFDPGGDLDKRPPLDELRVIGSYLLSPLDPTRFVYK